MTYEEYQSCRRDYQAEGAEFLLTVRHCCLFYKPGKGKTYPAIDAIREVNRSMNGKAKVLIMSTADAIKNMWASEIEPQGILPDDTLLMTFNSAIIEGTKRKLMSILWDIIVIDESHKIKSHNAKISKLCHMLTKRCKYVWGLTGTPRGNNDLDIFCQFHNMCISDYGDITYAQFVNICCDVTNKFFGGAMIPVPIGISAKYRDGWNRQVAMNSQTIGYNDDDGMPELTVNEVKIDYKVTDEYKRAEEGIISVGDYESTMNKLTAIQKAHQAANGFLYVPVDDKITTHRFQHNKKLDWLQTNLTNKPTLIVYRHIADAEDLRKQFAYATENIDDFKAGKSKLLLLQCSRCESFNLQMCNRIIFYTMDYSYIKYNQMIHRAWRMGQQLNVDITVLIQKETIEQTIWTAVQNKSTLSDALFASMKEYIHGRNVSNVK